MKKLTWVLLATSIVSLALTFTGCQEPEDLINERMGMFQDDVEAGNYGNLKDHTSPLAGMYTAANASFWETLFLSSTDFSYSVSGNNADVTVGSLHFTFYLKEITPDVYKIYKIVNDDSGLTLFQ